MSSWFICKSLKVYVLRFTLWGRPCSLTLRVNVRWPRELQKTRANRESTSKSRTHLHQFDSRWSKRSQHKQIHVICSAFLFWLCCQNDESVFFIFQVFFSICSALSSLQINICWKRFSKRPYDAICTWTFHKKNFTKKKLYTKKIYIYIYKKKKKNFVKMFL